MVNHAASCTALRFMCCTIADQTYGLNMAWVRGIQRAEQLQRQQDEPGTVGWIVHEHEEIPVYSLARQFNQACEDRISTGNIVVLRALRHPWALLVDRMEGIIQVHADDVLRLPAMARNPAALFFDGVVQCAGGMLLSLDPEHLCPDVTRRAALPRLIAELPEALPPMTGMPPTHGRKGQLICFATGDERAHEQAITFGLSVAQVPHILTAVPLVPVPGAAACVLGLVNWQGCPLAVIDLSLCLGGTASVVKHDSRLLIARASTTRACLGFPVRPNVTVCTLPLEHHVSTRHLPLQECLLRGKFDLGHTMLVIPDIDRILVAMYDPAA